MRSPTRVWKEHYDQAIEKGVAEDAAETNSDEVMKEYLAASVDEIEALLGTLGVDHVEIDIRFPPDKLVRVRYNKVEWEEGQSDFFPREVRLVGWLTTQLHEADGGYGGLRRDNDLAKQKDEAMRGEGDATEGT